MQLLLVRHGEPLAVSGQTGGADPELSTQGHAQAAALGSWASDLTGEKVVEVVVSGMLRAQQSAAPAAAALGLEPVVDPDLAEFDVGRPSYAPVHERLGSEDPDWQRITAGWFPSFVDVEAFTARVRGAFDRIVARHRSRSAAEPDYRHHDSGRTSVLVVCHAGVINTYLALQLGLERPLTFPLDHAGLSRVLVSRAGRVRVRSVNETGHVTDVL